MPLCCCTNHKVANEERRWLIELLGPHFMWRSLGEHQGPVVLFLRLVSTSPLGWLASFPPAFPPSLLPSTYPTSTPLTALWSASSSWVLPPFLTFHRKGPCTSFLAHCLPGAVCFPWQSLWGIAGSFWSLQPVYYHCSFAQTLFVARLRAIPLALTGRLFPTEPPGKP